MIALLVLVASVGLLWLYNPTWGLLVGIALGMYLISCALKPRSDCWWCGGGYQRGRREGRSSFRWCWVCKGRRGERARWGALIWRRNRWLYRDRELDDL